MPDYTWRSCDINGDHIKALFTHDNILYTDSCRVIDGMLYSTIKYYDEKKETKSDGIFVAVNVQNGSITEIGNIMMIIRIILKNLNIQNTDMIVIRHIQTRDIIVIIQDIPKKIIPGARTKGFKRTAAGTSHINTNTHIICTVIQDGDIVKHDPLPVAVTAPFHMLPGYFGKAQQLLGSFDTVDLRGEGQPVYKNLILLYSRFLGHNCTPCRFYPPVSGGG